MFARRAGKQCTRAEYMLTLPLHFGDYGLPGSTCTCTVTIINPSLIRHAYAPFKLLLHGEANEIRSFFRLHILIVVHSSDRSVYVFDAWDNDSEETAAII